jgi:hypothetical protein
MAAGLGYKEFATGDVLTAADANGYLASQVVMVFASSAARTSAIASPQEGMISYLKDTDVTQYYSGSAWTSIGGASGGMTSIASGSLSGSALSLTSISGSYKNLQLVLRNADTSASCNMTLQVNNLTTGIYQRVTIYNNDAAFASAASQNATSSQLNGSTIKLERSNTAIINFEDYANTTSYKQFMAQLSYEKAGSGLETAWTLGNLDSVAAISRIDLTLSTGTFRAGTYILYGVN